MTGSGRNEVGTAAPALPAAKIARPELVRFCMALVGVALICYSNALGGPFIFDDRLSILENLNIRSLWPPWVAAWADHESPMAGRPIPALSLAFNYAFGGLSPFGYKLVNLVLHVGCVLALFCVVRLALRAPAFVERFGARADAYAFASALLFAVHPLASECVNYVTQRTESWMALFYLAALACAARAHLGPRGLDAPSTRWRAAAVACCAAGMASKEVMVSAPLMILLFDRACTGLTIPQLLRASPRYYAALASCWLLAAALMSATFRSDTVSFDQGVSGLGYLYNQSWVIPRYFRLALWPSGLSLDWGVPRAVELADIAGGLLLVAALALASAELCVRRAAVGFPLLFVFAVLSPTSSAIPILTEVGAERRMYLPLAALCAVAAVGLGSLLWKKGRSPRGAVVVLVGVALALAATTFVRNAEYRSALVLWAGAAAVFPDNARAHANVGSQWIDSGEYARAVQAIALSLEADPGYVPAHNLMGVALANVGRRGEARGYLERAIELEPDFASPHYNLALVQLAAGEREEAMRGLERTLELNARHESAALQLAWLLATDAAVTDATARRSVELAERAIALGSASSVAFDVLAAAYAAAGRFEQARKYGEVARTRALREGADVAPIARRLEAYRAGRAWVEVR